MEMDFVDYEPVLTKRELHVLELVAHGFSAKEIAGRIEIAPRTVERHIDNVRMKLQARNRTHMIAQAIRRGVLQIEPRTPAVEPNDGLLLKRRLSDRPAAVELKLV